MIAAQVNGIRVLNIIVVTNFSVMPDLIDGTGLSIGDKWNGEHYVTPPPPLPTTEQYTVAIQAMLDQKSRERRYDGILSACTYATSPSERFQAEGQACVDWRDAVWSRSYELMDQVQTGEIPQPTIAELLAMLPTMTWPA